MTMEWFLWFWINNKVYLENDTDVKRYEKIKKIGLIFSHNLNKWQ